MRLYKWLQRRLVGIHGADALMFLFLVGAVILLAAGGVALSRFAADNLARSLAQLVGDAEATSNAWAKDLAARTDDFPAMIVGLPPSEATKSALGRAMQIGRVYRFKIWNRTGDLVFTSDEMGPPAQAQTLAKGRGQRVAAGILSGSMFIATARGVPPRDPAYFSDVYWPIMRGDAVLGIVEVYIDQTEEHRLYDRTFLKVQGIAVLLVLLAGALPGAMVYFKVKAQRSAEGRATFLATHDPLTGIANRSRLAETARVAMALAQQTNSYVALLLLDIGRFKEINDSFGHAVGDRLLRAFAIRLGESVHGDDMAARLGGDVFAVLQIGTAQPERARVLAERLIQKMSIPFEIDGQQLLCRVSIGVAIGPSDSDNADVLLQHAETALYRAKAEGRDAARFFELGMDAAMRQRHQLEGELRRALTDKAFRLNYQPIYSFHDGMLVGFEALLRWPLGRPVKHPVEFIPIAEETGLIVEIGAWVLQTACAAAASWGRPLALAVNLSPVQFRRGDIVATVLEALSTSGLAPQRLELEVTEGVLIGDIDRVLEQLVRLRSLGVAISLDDFGTGYSSLSYLWRFPFDKVKIDQSFVTGMNVDPKAAAIVNTILGLSRTLNLSVTAEGVEAEDQVRALNKLSCNQAQGFLLGRPMSAAAASELVKANAAAPAMLSPEYVASYTSPH